MGVLQLQPLLLPVFCYCSCCRYSVELQALSTTLPVLNAAASSVDTCCSCATVSRPPVNLRTHAVDVHSLLHPLLWPVGRLSSCSCMPLKSTLC